MNSLLQVTSYGHPGLGRATVTAWPYRRDNGNANPWREKLRGRWHGQAINIFRNTAYDNEHIDEVPSYKILE